MLNSWVWLNRLHRRWSIVQAHNVASYRISTLNYYNIDKRIFKSSPYISGVKASSTPPFLLTEVWSRTDVSAKSLAQVNWYIYHRIEHYYEYARYNLLATGEVLFGVCLVVTQLYHKRLHQEQAEFQKMEPFLILCQELSRKRSSWQDPNDCRKAWQETRKCWMSSIVSLSLSLSLKKFNK